MDDNDFYYDIPEENSEYKIGKVSELTGISVKMLRYYDKINLCKPSYVDPDSSYRYYTNDAITLLIVIKELQAHGFTSPEIKELFDKKDVNTIKQLYHNKKAEIQKKIESLNVVKTRIDKQIDLIENLFFEKNTNINSKYIIKEIPERKYLSRNIKTDINLEKIKFLINSAQKAALLLNIPIIEPYLIIVKDLNTLNKHQLKEKNDFDIIACATLSQPNKKLNKTMPHFTFMPAGKYVTKTYKSSIGGEQHIKAYFEMIEWMKKNGYEKLSEPAFIYLNNVQHWIEGKKALIELQIRTQKLK